MKKYCRMLEAFQLAKEVYKVETSPKPDVHISLKGREELKKQASFINRLFI